MIVFQCPECKTKLQVADQHAGMTIQCPNCKGRATAPKAEGAVAEAIAPAPPPPETPTGVTTPEVAQAQAERRREGEPDLERPQPRRDGAEAAKAAGAGMGLGAMLLLIFGILGCCSLGVVAILVALLVPAVQKVREAAARTQSTNNLKQISLAAMSFHDANRRLPFNGADAPDKFGGPGYSKAAQGGNSQSGSWGFQLLPYIDQAPLFQNPNAGKNAGVAAYMCPGRSRPPFESGAGPWTDYFYNNYLNAANNNPDQPDRPDLPDCKLTMVGVTDGTSNTIFFGHGSITTSQYSLPANVTLSTNIFQGGTFGTARAGNPGRANPGGMTLKRDSEVHPNLGSWGGPFPQGGLMAMGDGTVRMFRYDTPQFGGFLTPQGGENVMLPD